MSVSAPPVRRLRPRSGKPTREVRQRDRLGDAVLYGSCAIAAVIGFFVLAEIVYQVVNGSSLSISRFGLGFIGHTTWEPNFNVFGAGVMLFGTAICATMALLIAVPLGVAIALYLATVASNPVRAVVGPLVEMLAAIPSVILGFWGVIVLAPFVHEDLEPVLHGAFGFIPLFGAAQTTGASLFTAGLILSVMVLPIVAALSRDLFLRVPRELQDGALALGATRWEVLRGVVLPSTASGVVAAAFLGLGRALGEAIAVTQVVGAGNIIHASLFTTGDTLASRIAEQFPGAISKLHTASLFYLAAMLLAIGLFSNLLAQWISRHFSKQRGVTA